MTNDNSVAMQLPISGESASFEFNPRYRCIRNLCHVMTATKVLAGLCVILWTLKITFSLPVSLTYTIIPIVIAICTTIAFKQERHCFLWPLVVHNAICFALSLVMSVVFIGLVLAFGQDVLDFLEEQEVNTPGVPAPVSEKHHMGRAGFFFLCVLIELVLVVLTVCFYWQMIVVYRCKEYLDDKCLASMPLIVEDPQSISSAARQYALANGYDQPPPAYSDAPTEGNAEEQQKY